MKAFLLLSVTITILGSSLAQAKESLLIVGDSHTVGSFGEGLASGLKDQFEVTRVGSCGARAQSYFKDYKTRCGFVWKSEKKDFSLKESQTPRFSELLKAQPQNVVIALGTNFLGSSSDAVIKEADKLMAEIPPGVHCFWVGPPDIRGLDKKQKISEIDQALAKAAAARKCSYISIKDKIPYPTTGGDGVHFSHSDGKSLGAKTAAEVRTKYKKTLEGKPAQEDPASPSSNPPNKGSQ